VRRGALGRASPHELAWTLTVVARPRPGRRPSRARAALRLSAPFTRATISITTARLDVRACVGLAERPLDLRRPTL